MRSPLQTRLQPAVARLATLLANFSRSRRETPYAFSMAGTNLNRC